MEGIKNKRCKKVPVIMQMEALECGAASLAMILAYYKKWIPLEQLREDCGVSRDGSKASNVAKAAVQHGLKVQAHRYGMDSVQTKVRYPAIIHWNFNHFVVLLGFSKEYAHINDPARGKVKVPLEEFDASFTGVCLEFEPGETFVPSGKPESMVKFAARRLKGTETLILFVMLTAALTSFAGLVTPALSRFFTDQVLGSGNSEWTSALLTAVLCLFFFQLAVGILNAVYLFKIQGKLAVVSNSAFMWHILQMPMKFFSQRMAGDLSGRQALNDQIAATLISRVSPILINAVLLVFYLAVMLRYSLILSLVGILAVGLNLAAARMISAHRLDTTRIRMRDEGNLSAATVSGIEMIETIKVSGAENSYFERWAGYAASSNQTDVREERENRFLNGLPVLIQEISDVVILTIGVWMIMKGNFTAGMLVAFQAVLLQFMNPVNDLIDTGQSIQEMRSSMERVDDVMKYKIQEESHVKIEEGKTYRKLRGEIELKNVTFGYSRLSEPLLKNFSLTIHQGDKIALVGMSGCGKSTIAKLVSGLYEPWEGEILYDGKKRLDIPKEVFTGSLLVVDQDITMFEDSISDNIKMWDQTIEDYEVIMAARDAQIHDDIMQRPGGYDYMMKDGGKDFSGGQRQRFEIARVLAGDPTIAILDEATSALDAKTEYEVTKAIQERGITCIVIAHRLSTIRDSDQILVMEKGEVKEQGTHEELYQMDGLYRRLISTE